MVNVKQIAEMGAYVQLLEYNNIEGMILLSELSRRRIRSINKLIRVGKHEVVMVIRVDKEKGYIDLSKRRVSSEDVAKTEERFNKAKAVHATLRHVTNRRLVPMAQLYKRIAWPLYKKYGHCYDAFQLAVASPDTIFSDPVEVSEDEKREAVEYIRSKMTPQPLKVRADVQVTCFAYDGIEAIRAALLAAQGLSTEAVPIKVQLIAPPLYVMLTTTLNKDEGIAALNAAIEAARVVLESHGGRMQIKSAPSVTTDQDESELARMLHGAAGEGEGDEEDEDGEGEEEAFEEGMGSAELPGLPGLGDVAGGAGGATSFEDAAAAEARASTAATAAKSAARLQAERAALSAAGVGAGAAAAASAAAPAAAAAAAAPPAPSPSQVTGADGQALTAGDTSGEVTFTGKKKKAKAVAVVEE
jgi:translation initiation factor 2 subunit 1